MNTTVDSTTLAAGDTMMAAGDTVTASLLGTMPDSVATTGIVAFPTAPSTAAVPEQIGLWGLLGILYPLMLVVGLRLLRIGLRRARVWSRHRLGDWESWLRGAGVAAVRARLLCRAGEVVLRFTELAFYVLCIYIFSLYFFLLIPGTRELGLGMASQFWPPLRAAILLMLRTFTYIAFGAAVLFSTRWVVLRLRERLGAAAAHPTTPRERERLFILRFVNWLLYCGAAVVIIVVMPGPGRQIGLLFLGLSMLVLVVASRRALENVAAGFSVGRVIGVRPGVRVICGGCRGVIQEWTLTGLHLRDDQGNLVYLPYRLCEETPLTIEESAGDPA